MLRIIMSLSLPDRALIVKLFYQNDNSTVFARQKFQTLKGMRKSSGGRDKASNIHDSISVLRVAEAVDISRSTVQSIMRRILR